MKSVQKGQERGTSKKFLISKRGSVQEKSLLSQGLIKETFIVQAHEPQVPKNTYFNRLL